MGTWSHSLGWMLAESIVFEDELKDRECDVVQIAEMLCVTIEEVAGGEFV